MELRPEPASTDSRDSGSEEIFQNKTLRPILRVQSNLLIEIFRTYIKKHKNVFHELNLERRLIYIENAILKDIKFRNSLKGIIVGHFTSGEYEYYSKAPAAINKRMMNLVKTELQDKIQLLETPQSNEQ